MRVHTLFQKTVTQSVLFFFILGTTACSTGRGEIKTTAAEAQAFVPDRTEAAPVVYMTTDISSSGLVEIYEALGREATGRISIINKIRSINLR
jgi:hypothetical protein